MAQMTCDTAICPNAAGYYSRLPAALSELENVPLISRQTVKIPQKHIRSVRLN